MTSSVSQLDELGTVRRRSGASEAGGDGELLAEVELERVCVHRMIGSPALGRDQGIGDEGEPSVWWAIARADHQSGGAIIVDWNDDGASQLIAQRSRLVEGAVVLVDGDGDLLDVGEADEERTHLGCARVPVGRRVEQHP